MVDDRLLFGSDPAAFDDELARKLGGLTVWKRSDQGLVEQATCFVIFHNREVRCVHLLNAMSDARASLPQQLVPVLAPIELARDDQAAARHAHRNAVAENRMRLVGFPRQNGIPPVRDPGPVPFPRARLAAPHPRTRTPAQPPAAVARSL